MHNKCILSSRREQDKTPLRTKPPPTKTHLRPKPPFCKPPLRPKPPYCKNPPLAKTPLRQNPLLQKKHLVNPFTVNVRIPNAYINLKAYRLFECVNNFLHILMIRVTTLFLVEKSLYLIPEILF